MNGIVVCVGILVGLILVSEAGNWEPYVNKVETTIELTNDEFSNLNSNVNVLSARRIQKNLVKATVIMDKSEVEKRNRQRLFRRGKSKTSRVNWIELAKKIHAEQERLQNRKVFLSGMDYSEFDFNTFHNLSEIYSFLHTVTTTFPEKTSLFLVGRTFELRKILAVKIGYPSTWKEKKSIILNGAIHAREWVTTAAMLRLVHELLTNPENEDLLRDIDFYIIPVLNADGYQYTWTDNRYWRKSRHVDPKTGLDGVDLNRNFPTLWAPGTKTSGPETEAFPGFRPMSEIENISLDKFVESLGKSVISYWDVHSYSQIIMYPIAAKCHTHGKDFVEHLKVSSIFIHGVQQRNGTKFIKGTPCDLLYAATGTTFDHFYLKRNIIYSFGVELFPSINNAKNDFVIELDNIERATMDFINGFIPVVRYLQDQIHTGFFDHL